MIYQMLLRIGCENRISIRNDYYTLSNKKLRGEAHIFKKLMIYRCPTKLLDFSPECLRVFTQRLAKDFLPISFKFKLNVESGMSKDG